MKITALNLYKDKIFVRHTKGSSWKQRLPYKVPEYSETLDTIYIMYGKQS